MIESPLEPLRLLYSLERPKCILWALCAFATAGLDVYQLVAVLVEATGAITQAQQTSVWAMSIGGVGMLTFCGEYGIIRPILEGEGAEGKRQMYLGILGMAVIALIIAVLRVDPVSMNKWSASDWGLFVLQLSIPLVVATVAGWFVQLVRKNLQKVEGAGIGYDATQVQLEEAIQMLEALEIHEAEGKRLEGEYTAARQAVQEGQRKLNAFTEQAIQNCVADSRLVQTRQATARQLRDAGEYPDEPEGGASGSARENGTGPRPAGTGARPSVHNGPLGSLSRRRGETQE